MKRYDNIIRQSNKKTEAKKGVYICTKATYIQFIVPVSIFVQ